MKARISLKKHLHVLIDAQERLGAAYDSQLGIDGKGVVSESGHVGRERTRYEGTEKEVTKTIKDGNDGNMEIEKTKKEGDDMSRNEGYRGTVRTNVDGKTLDQEVGHEIKEAQSTDKQKITVETNKIAAKNQPGQNVINGKAQGTQSNLKASNPSTTVSETTSVGQKEPVKQTDATITKTPEGKSGKGTDNTAPVQPKAANSQQQTQKTAKPDQSP